MRRLRTTEALIASGFTKATLATAVRAGLLTRIESGVYGDGPDPPTLGQCCRARLLVTDGVATGTFAAAVLGMKDVVLRGPDIAVDGTRSAKRDGVRRRALDPERIIECRGMRTTDPLQTLLDLAVELSDDEWEWALENALRMRLVTVEALISWLDSLDPSPRGVVRIRRVLAQRPPGAPATGSVLETRFIQVARRVPGLPPPERQLEISSVHGTFIAFVDLAWRSLGLFVELDGQGHKDQPVYDANRETAVVAATGWFPARFTWREVVETPRATTRRFAAVVEQCHRRPLPS